MDPRFWQLFLSAELGAEKSRAFLKDLGTSSDPIASLLSWRHLTPAQRARIDRSDERRLKQALDAGVTVLEPSDLPDKLSDLPAPPHALFAWGDTEALHKPTVGIVGTRKSSPYGEAVAAKFAEAFALAGVCVVSGGALGIDAAAHKGALSAQGATVAVLGHSIDKVFPASHGPLFQSIRNSGCLVSQFPVGKPSMPDNFLVRNQLVAALSDAVLVVEAPERSGALSTATHAANINRPVFVVPGSITQFTFKGSHALVRDGATLVDHPDQVFDEMGWQPFSLQTQTAQPESAKQEAIIATLTETPVCVERLATATNLDPADLLTELTMLELQGLVVRSSSGYSLKP